jgi:hypothetical protein
MNSPPVARSSIFISHVNGDASAEPVLAAITAKLKSELGGMHEGYNLVWDRESISAGDEWRTRIYEWLEECPAAVILISPGAFLPEKPWVAYETFYLTVRRKIRRGLVIIPVVIGIAEEQVKRKPDFEPANIREIKWVSCPDPNDQAALAKVVKEIAAALKSSGLRPRGTIVLEGIARGIAEILDDHPEVHEAIARALESQVVALTADEIAVRLIEANEGAIREAIRAFVRTIRFPDDPKRQKELALRTLCKILSAREVPSAAALSLAVEMAKPAKVTRAVLLDSTDDEVTSLYVTRAAGRVDHRWRFLDVSPGLELSAADQARIELDEALRKGLAPQKEDREEALIWAKATAATRRRSGIPAVFRVNLPDECDCRLLVATARETAAACGLLLRAKRKLPPAEFCPVDTICRLEPPPEGQRERLIGLSGTLDQLCDDEVAGF